MRMAGGVVHRNALRILSHQFSWTKVVKRQEKRTFDALRGRSFPDNKLINIEGISQLHARRGRFRCLVMVHNGDRICM